MRTQRYEVVLQVEGEVRHARLAQDPGQAASWSKSDVEDAISEGLKAKLSGGSSSFDVDVSWTREVTEDDL